MLVKIQAILENGIEIKVDSDNYFISYKDVPLFLSSAVSDVLAVSIMGDSIIAWNRLDLHIGLDMLRNPEKLKYLILPI